MNNDLLEKCRNEIFKLGYTVLEDLIPEHYLDLLNKKMDEDAAGLMAMGVRGGYASVQGHLQLNPPPFAPYVIPEIIAHPVVCAITKSILGDDVVSNFYSGNTNCPNSEPQPVHCDFGHLWEHNPGHPPANLVINIVFEDVTELNGSTEIWPGSHMDFSFVCKFMDISMKKTITAEALDKRRKISPPIRLNLKKGSTVIRDPRVWHRGMTNHHNRVRHMLAMIHSSSWVEPGLPFRFHPNCKNVFDNSPIKHNIVYIEEPFNYLEDPTE